MVRPALLVPCFFVLASCDDPAPTVARDASVDARVDVPLQVPTYTGPARAELSAGGVRVTLRLDRFGMLIARADGTTVLDTLDAQTAVAGDALGAYTSVGGSVVDTALRPVLIEGWDHVASDESPWRHATAVARATVTAREARVELYDPGEPAARFHVHVEVDADEVRVEVRATALDTPLDAGEGALGINRVGQSFALRDDEHFYGLGERFVTVDHRGARYECWVEEGGVGGGEHTPINNHNPSPNGPGMTHAPIPFVLSSHGYGLWIDATARTGFVLGADAPSAWRIYAAEPVMRYRVLVHDDPRDTLAHFTRLTGRAVLPADWVFAPRRRVDHGAMVHGMPEYMALRASHVPTTAVDDATHFLPHASQLGREDELRTWNDTLHAQGFRSIGYFNPYVSTSRPQAQALLAYGRAHGLFVRRDDGQEFDTALVSGGSQSVATIDLTNPEAVTWYQSLLQGALDLGYDGWMLDFAEYIPPRAVMHDGTLGWSAHNAFPVLYERVTFDYLRRVRGDDFMFFARAGYTGTQSVVPLLWSGDPSSSFEEARGLPANVRAGLNAGMSGIPFWGSDISGYTCLNDPPADKEVYLRWAEFGALSPDMHDENACSGAAAGAPPKWTLWSDDETTTVYARYARLHTRLVPYIHAAAQESVRTGVPIMRHPFLMNPTEAGARAAQYDYWFGPSLYAAPVVHRGERARALWLPPGRWIDWWSLAVTDGGATVTRDAPLDVIPLYQRAGTVVPLLDPEVETLVADRSDTVVSAPERADVLDARAAVSRAMGASGTAALVDGATMTATLAEAAPAMPDGYTAATSDAQLASCTRCARITALSGGAVRVQVTTERATTATVRAGSLTLTHASPTARRLRWDVVVTP